MNTKSGENPDLPPIIKEPPPIPVRKRSSPWIWGVLVVVFCVAGFVGFRVVQFVEYMRAHPRAAQPGELEFREANKEIITGEGNKWFGNNADARALAEEYSKSLKTLRESLITKGDPTAVGSLEGDFVTYCQLNEDSCVFLVHVPELRRFTDEAKRSITDAAWMNAQAVIQAKVKPPPKTVVVGVKGLLLYEAIMVGDYVAKPEPDKDGIATRGSGLQDMELLYPYFAPKTTTPLLTTNENDSTR